MATVTLEDIHFSYKNKQVLRGISLDLDRGEVVGLLGPNGSGKSTITKLIARVLRPRSGQIRLDGNDIQHIPRRTYARAVAYVPQVNITPFELTVREAVLLGRSPHYAMRPTAADVERVHEALAALGLAELADRRMTELSGGQAQRVAIARALAQDPRVLLMDEPTSALDLKFQIETLRTVRRLADSGDVGVLLAIHDLNHAAAYCDRVVLLESGAVHTSGRPEHALTADVIQNVYGVAVAVETGDRVIHVRVNH